MTGFRIGKLGQWGRDGAVEGWKPDLVTFGKVMGGGFPAAAFGGRADVMTSSLPRVRSTKPAPCRGTRSRRPLGLTTLRLANDEVYAHIDRAAAVVQEAAAKALTEAGVPHVVQAAGTMFSVFLGVTDSVSDFEAANRMDIAAYKAFFHSMLDQGVYLPPSAYEVWFLSSAHDDAALDRIVSALPAAAEAAAHCIDDGSHDC